MTSKRIVEREPRCRYYSHFKSSDFKVEFGSELVFILHSQQLNYPEVGGGGGSSSPPIKLYLNKINDTKVLLFLMTSTTHRSKYCN